MPSRRLALLLLLLGIGRSHAADQPPPDLPDPYGLGPRLVLLDQLRTKYGLKPPEDATYEQLVALYWTVEKPRQGEPAVKLDDATMVEDEALVRDRVNRLRATLKEEFKYDAPAGASEADLVAELRKRRDQRQQQAIDDSTKRNAQEHVAGRLADDGDEAAAKQDASAKAAAANGDLAPLWRQTVHETWQAIQGIPIDQPPLWNPIETSPATNGNPYRVRRAQGKLEYPDRLPAWEDGMEVWIQHDNEGYAGHREARWYPATWMPEAREWTIENPACYRWEREAKLYGRLVQLLVSGPRSDEARLQAWAARRKPLTAPNDPKVPEAAQDPAFLDICAAAAKDGGFADQLVAIETDAIAIEREYPELVDAHRQYHAAADLLAGGKKDADPDHWRKELDRHSGSIQQLHTHRRQLLATLVSTIPK